MEKNYKHTLIITIVISVLISSSFGAVMGFWGATLFESEFSLSSWFNQAVLGKSTQRVTSGKNQDSDSTIINVEEESAVIDVVEKVSPAVVSIIVTKDLPIIERYYTNPFEGSDFFDRFFGNGFEGFFEQPQYRQRGTEQREVGGGTGFIINSEGHIITNKHVVLDEAADYSVLMNDETTHEASVLARDPINDLAILKIEGENLPFIELGNSSGLKVGQSVVAIGNALAEFSNTVSTGVISGLSRSIVAGGSGIGSEQLTNVIQTDASINPGNSGGPLLNLLGQAIGINTAIVRGASNIGFAIPINEVKSIYESVKTHGRIVRPFLGVRYIMINEMVKEANNLEVDYGALIVRGQSEMDLAVIPGSPANKAGLTENDIILEINGKKIDRNNPLNKAIAQLNIGDTVKLKIFTKGEEKEVTVTLEEMDQPTNNK
jgi:S1-C subfamily serine protease